MIRGGVPLVTLSSLLAGCAGTPRVAVATAEAACTVATARVTAERDLPTAHVAICDPVSEADRSDGYYLLGLRAHCREELCGSTLMGWFAVEKTTGAVFEWDVAKERIRVEVGGE
jgi:hypothetical protein